MNNKNNMITSSSASPNHISELEKSPNICHYICKLCADYNKNFAGFNKQMDSMIKTVKADLMREPSQNSQNLYDELIFVHAFINKKVIAEYCEEAA